MRVILTIPLCFCIGSAIAQSFYNIRRDRDLIVTLGTGTASYYGEMVNPGQMGKLRPNIVAGGEYFFSNRLAGRAELSWFQLAGSDENANDDRRRRNLSFTSSNFELSVAGVVNLFPQSQRFYQRPTINFYGFVGPGLIYFNPKAEYQGKKYALQPLMTEGVKYSRFQPVLLFGGGIKYKPNPFFNVLIEGGYRKTFTDYLDDVSSVRYPDPSTLKSDLSRALSDRRAEFEDPAPPYNIGRRGNPEKKDAYLLINLKIQYYLPYNFLSDPNRKLYNQKRKAYYRRRR